MKDEKQRRDPLKAVERLIATLAKYLGYYTTAAKIAQLIPVLVGVAVVLFSPTAWLSATLRTWAYVAMGAGSLAGMLTLGALVTRGRDRSAHAVWALATLLVAGALLRLHLAIIDIGFVDRWTVFRPLQDFYLGSDAGEWTFNALAAAGFGLAVWAATVGLPLFLKWRRGGSGAVATATGTSSPAKIREAMDVLESAFVELQGRIEELEGEKRALERRVAEKEQELSRLTREGAVPREEREEAAP